MDKYTFTYTKNNAEPNTPALKKEISASHPEEAMQTFRQEFGESCSIWSVVRERDKSIQSN